MTNIIFNTDLVDDLARERVVLFLGAGVSSSAVTAKGGHIAGWATFLKSMSNLCAEPLREQVRALLQKNDLLLACEILQSTLADSWEKHLSDEFGQKAEPSKLHSAIMRLRQRIILTTNFDKLIETSWDAEDKISTHYPSVTSKIDENVFRILKDHSGRHLIKIHGTIDDTQTIIFSRSEYIRLAFGNAQYSAFLENLMLNYTFLFIGFSMDDPAIISLMEMYALRYKSARPHYIVTSDKLDRNVEEIYKKLRKLVFIKYDRSDNHANLPILVNKLADEVAERRREIFANSIR